YGLEILHGVVRRFGIQRWRNSDGVQMREEQRVAVRLSSCHERGANRAVGAGLILDDDCLAKPGTELLRDGTNETVGRATGCPWIDDGDGPRRIGVGGERRSR